jgi:hypothetical protein
LARSPSPPRSFIRPPGPFVPGWYGNVAAAGPMVAPLVTDARPAHLPPPPQHSAGPVWRPFF